MAKISAPIVPIAAPGTRSPNNVSVNGTANDLPAAAARCVPVNPCCEAAAAAAPTAPIPPKAVPKVSPAVLTSVSNCLVTVLPTDGSEVGSEVGLVNVLKISAEASLTDAVLSGLGFTITSLATPIKSCAVSCSPSSSP